MFLTTLKQRRFGETFAPAEAILIAWFLIEAHRWIVHFLTARNADGYKAAIASGSLLATLTFFAFTSGFNVIYESPVTLIKSWTNQRDDYVGQTSRYQITGANISTSLLVPENSVVTGQPSLNLDLRSGRVDSQ